MNDLLSSAEAASLLGVSPTSVKRWADEGLLPCVRTAGQHRRFERAALERFRQSQMGDVAAGQRDEDEAWLALILGGSPQQLEAQLLDERAARGSFAPVADLLGGVLQELGRRWAAGGISVMEEHLASERLARALARLCEWMPSRPAAPKALLATAEGDDHTLGLSLAELTLREVGWSVLWAGRSTPTEEVERLLASQPVNLVIVTATVSSQARALAAQLRRLEKACAQANASLVVGGSGLWPEPSRFAVRLNRFSDLAAHVARI